MKKIGTILAVVVGILGVLYLTFNYYLPSHQSATQAVETQTAQQEIQIVHKMQR